MAHPAGHSPSLGRVLSTGYSCRHLSCKPNTVRQLVFCCSEITACGEDLAPTLRVASPTAALRAVTQAPRDSL